MEQIKKKLAKIVIYVVYACMVMSFFLLIKEPELSVKLMLAVLNLFE